MKLPLSVITDISLFHGVCVCECEREFHLPTETINIIATLSLTLCVFMCVFLCCRLTIALLFSPPPHFLSVPVTQPVHHCPPTNKQDYLSFRLSSPAHSLLFIQGFCPFLLWRSTILHLSHLIALPFFPPSHHPTYAPVSQPTHPALQSLSNWYAGPYFWKIFFSFVLFFWFGLILCYSSPACPLCSVSLLHIYLYFMLTVFRAAVCLIIPSWIWAIKVHSCLLCHALSRSNVAMVCPVAKYMKKTTRV